MLTTKRRRISLRDLGPRCVRKILASYLRNAVTDRAAKGGVNVRSSRNDARVLMSEFVAFDLVSRCR